MHTDCLHKCTKTYNTKPACYKLASCWWTHELTNM